MPSRTIMDASKIDVPPFDRVEFNGHLAIARNRVGEEARGTSVSEGSNTKTEQAVDYALAHMPST